MLHHYFTAHEQTHKTESATFVSLMCSLLPEDPYPELIFSAAGVVPCGGRKTSLHT